MSRPIIYVTPSLVCPGCNSPELHPDGDKLLIRGHKVVDDEGSWSQCLVCAGYYDADLNETPANFNDRKGWFMS